MTLAWAGYRVLAPLAGSLAPLGRWLAPAPERDEWVERLGDVADGGEPADAWIHAASMGEGVAISGLIAALRSDAPDARFRLTATTRTGKRRLEALREPVSLAPIDTPQAIGRFLARVRPRRLMLLETELWPQWLLAARARGTPVLVLNARLSARSLTRYRWLGPAFARLVANLGAVLCQSDSDHERWLALGAPADRTVTTGNLKYDGLPEPVADRAAARRALGLDPDRSLLVLGSLRPGEARPLAAAWRSLPETATRGWQVVAVPRHAAAAPELRREAEEARGSSRVRSTASEGGWRWDERPGVLRDYYAAAEVAFVGGTLAPFGGHNPLEPAACGAAVLAGPSLESQGPGVAILNSADAIEIVDRESLEAGLLRLLENRELREIRGARALAAATSARGATRRAVEQLVGWGLWP